MSIRVARASSSDKLRAMSKHCVDDVLGPSHATRNLLPASLFAWMQCSCPAPFGLCDRRWACDLCSELAPALFLAPHHGALGLLAAGLVYAARNIGSERIRPAVKRAEAAASQQLCETQTMVAGGGHSNRPFER
jgi:hypothetical protein